MLLVKSVIDTKQSTIRCLQFRFNSDILAETIVVMAFNKINKPCKSVTSVKVVSIAFDVP